MVRICKDGKKKYVSVGISVKAKHWNFDKNEPKPNCPNREHICLLIASKKAEYEKEAIKLNSEGRDFTADGLHEKIQSPTVTRTVADIFNEYIEHLRQEKRTGYMKSVQQVYNSLVKYNEHLNIYFDEIDFRWLRGYEIWLKGEELALNTIGIRFRTLRTIYNYALTNDWVKAENYPFKKYKVAKLSEEETKLADEAEDYGEFLRTLEDKYHFRLDNCCWMSTTNLKERCYL
jgi:hypothetical protein